MPVEPKPLYLLSPIEARQELTDAVEDFQRIWLPKHQLEDGQLLHHYTDLNGLQGILSTRTLWFSHADTLNDPLEVRYGRQLVLDRLNSAIENETDQRARGFLSQLQTMVRGATDQIHDSFVTCFCEDGNLLSQWQGYADRGDGYSLGIEFSEDTRLARENHIDKEKYLFLRKVIYDPEIQESLVNDYLDRTIQAVKAVPNADPRFSAAMAGMQAASPLLDMVYCFKHPAFSEENEWRVNRVTAKHTEPEDIRFRSAASGFSPYRVTSVFDSVDGKRSFPLRQIHFGPKLDPTAIKSAISSLLQAESASGNSIKMDPNNVRITEPGFRLR